MTAEQEGKFAAWYKEYGTFQTYEVSRNAWQACLEANSVEAAPVVPEGYFRIGEEVDFRCKKSAPFTQATVELVSERGNTFSFGHMAELEVRRRSAWEPKNGEAVFALDYKDRVHVAIIEKIEPRDDGHDYGVRCQDGEYSLWKRNNLKPFDASKIGLPWSEL